ncbi:MAG: hypothetical protein ACM33T_03225 [Solirubrobacterales bacterium]
MFRPAILTAALLAASATAALAETVSCPELAAATQVGTCATPEELKIGFTGYCSDNARMYDKDSVTCASLDNYRKLKDVALWEAGEFQGYLTCTVPADTLRAGKATGISVAKDGAMTRVLCRYDNGATLALRTKKSCKVEGDRAECE